MISPLAFIDSGAKIGKNVEIGPFSFIDSGVEIGDFTKIYPNATVFKGAKIGKNCTIFSGAIISAEPQDLSFNGEESVCIIGDNTTIRECVTINRGTKKFNSYQTVVGENCLIMSYVHVGHDSLIGNNCVIANSVQIAGHVEMENDVWIGGNCAIQQFMKIGKHAYIGGFTPIRKHVPPFVMAANYDISFVGVNTIGLERKGYSKEQTSAVKDIYRILFQTKGLILVDAIQKVKNTIPESKEKNTILSFIDNLNLFESKLSESNKDYKPKSIIRFSSSKKEM